MLANPLHMGKNNAINVRALSDARHGLVASEPAFYHMTSMFLKVDGQIVRRVSLLGPTLLHYDGKYYVYNLCSWL